MEASIAPNAIALQKWLVLTVLSLACFLIMGAILISVGIYVPALEQDQGWAESSLGGAATLLLVGMSLSSIVSGTLIDRYDARYVIAGGLVVVGLGCMIAARSSTAAEFILALAVVGAGAGAATVTPAVTVLSALFAGRRGIALGIYFGSLALAGVIFPPVVNWMIETHGWRQSLLVTGAVAAILSVAPLFLTISRSSATDDGEFASDCGMTVEEGLRSPSFWILAVTVTFAVISVNGIVFAVVPFLMDDGFSSSKAISVFAIANIFTVPSLFLGGALADWLGTRKVLLGATFMQGVSSLCLAVMTYQQDLGLVAVGAFAILWGLSSGIPAQVGPMLLRDAVGARSYGTLLGINSAVYGLFSSLAAVMFGWLHDLTGGYTLAFTVSGLAACAAAPLTYLVLPRYARKLKPIVP